MSHARERALDSVLADALGAPIVERTAVAGGDTNRADRIALASGEVLFVKTQPGAAETVFPQEAEGLAWLEAAGALRVPKVRWAGPEALVLEWIESARRCREHDEQLGRGLAALHRFGAARFGGPQGNFVGRLAQDNTPDDEWMRFYRDRRLRPLVRRASAQLGPAVRQRFDLLYERLPSLLGPAEPPSRLHGDLWGGNVITDATGAPVLIDPAVYGGHREVDLAMMRLFGGFGPRVFDAYEEAWPLADGAARRVALYQLYPLLVHVCMFGKSYVAGVVRALATLTR